MRRHAQGTQLTEERISKRAGECGVVLVASALAESGSDADAHTPSTVKCVHCESGGGQQHTLRAAKEWKKERERESKERRKQERQQQRREKRQQTEWQQREKHKERSAARKGKLS